MERHHTGREEETRWAPTARRASIVPIAHCLLDSCRRFSFCCISITVVGQPARGLFDAGIFAPFLPALPWTNQRQPFTYVPQKSQLSHLQTRFPQPQEWEALLSNVSKENQSDQTFPAKIPSELGPIGIDPGQWGLPLRGVSRESVASFEAAQFHTRQSDS